MVQVETLKMIVKKIAMLSDYEIEKEEIILIRPDYYRLNTDQVVLYQHRTRMGPAKADLRRVINCRVREISLLFRLRMGAPEDDARFIDFIREYWDQSIELDSPITLIICSNLRGEQVKEYIEMFRFHSTLPSSSQE